MQEIDRPIHIMVDTETLGTSPGCAILSIGAVAFDPMTPWNPVTGQDMANEHRFVRLVSLESCLDAGLGMEPGTLRFWLSQDKEAINEAFGGTIPLFEALSELTSWLTSLCPGSDTATDARIWSHGATFDPPILAAAYDAVGIDVPWNFRNMRDTRTIFEAAGISYKGTHHTVIEDCLQQAEKVCEAYAIIQGRKALAA